MQEDKIKLIYIASNGRSGSTLLDLLLGCHPKIWTLGEFQILPWEIMTPRQTCGCGLNVKECPFWCNIVQKFDDQLTEGSIHKFRESHGQGKVLRNSELFRILMSQKSFLSHTNGFEGYGRENARVMNEIKRKVQDKKPVEYLVDASKDPYRLYWLAMSGYFSIYAIHLTKDPRAFVYSMIKNNSSDTRKTVRMSLRYEVENRIIDLVCKKAPLKESMHIRYEDLASHPQDTMKAVYQKFGIDFSDYDPDNFRQAENHAISGNQMRHRTDEISLDEKWRRNMPKSTQKIVQTITALAGRRYGYYKA
ncbi:sulfotransferase [Desulfohalobium retbaense]|uniref:Sulfotransferase n=1 Tax=Desulfohalobium retbaense (strain ATCC 49708 / DSM 5692 / JCM 16813 / HR100) TaxID=485915 RepID=C8X057_DESRD|nr:sulfotransferase [Desulfohalobium retbaense]ACV67682.1 hypothetical protein Dret_0381 [Desulfohalobium retbaense DSM 5692]